MRVLNVVYGEGSLTFFGLPHPLAGGIKWVRPMHT